jgi:hypothetical protein
MDFNLPEQLQRRICFALIPAKTLCWPPKLSHYRNSCHLDNLSYAWVLCPKLNFGLCRQKSLRIRNSNYGLAELVLMMVLLTAGWAVWPSQGNTAPIDDLIAAAKKEGAVEFFAAGAL